MAESLEDLLQRLCAVVPDYPEPGVTFRDLTPVFADGAALRQVVDALIEPFAGQFDAVAGVEARGFLLAAAAGYASGTGVITVRKAGKLPRAVYHEEYQLEYGSAALELHRDELPEGSRVLILDDVLATGGTLAAASKLFADARVEVVGYGVVLELVQLHGRAALAGHRVRSLLRLS
ncbi:adenine phosphoribosyltransferase [Psychromicrobium lacuslunae]|uniref:Adenine phosphoribosyltransferase n=1 Tax=Psychromicrobium lacuslunae TaxID=1618207 RepID=A0A0D4BWG0_9MICC|nr:adenine phosphoribosyltransferase [Psychromicrobium lacuslunae]AJT40639.1 adenine phosphoribosyltransferase [Psychromicrobium lacuslunae]